MSGSRKWTDPARMLALAGIILLLLMILGLAVTGCTNPVPTQPQPAVQHIVRASGDIEEGFEMELPEKIGPGLLDLAADITQYHVSAKYFRKLELFEEMEDRVNLALDTLDELERLSRISMYYNADIQEVYDDWRRDLRRMVSGPIW